MVRALALLTVLAALPAVAHADRGRGDGVYDRLEHDLVLAAVAGGGVTLAGGEAAPTLAVELRARVLGAAGPVVAGRWGPDASEHLFVGVELRPLFPALWLMDVPSGGAWAELLLQSIGFELGAGLTPLSGQTSVGLAFGLGLEIPLVLPGRLGEGVFLRLAARRIDADPRYRHTEAPDRSEWTVLAALTIQGGVRVGFASWEPPRYRP